jgi:hypothetical protein
MMPDELSLTDFLTRGTYGFIVFALIILLLLLTISWLTLPFIILKIKNMLIDINIQLMRMNKYLISIEDLMKSYSQTNKTEFDDELFKKIELTTKAPATKEENANLNLDDIKDITESPLQKDDDE